MDQQNTNPRFPEQNESNKIHGTKDDSEKKEKYVRNSGKAEDFPEDEDTSKMRSGIKSDDKRGSDPLTDQSGEEKKEDYINTDERKKDLKSRGL